MIDGFSKGSSHATATREERVALAREFDKPIAIDSA
jgi:hypothetical protein